MRDKGRVSFSCNLFQDEILFSHTLCTSGWFLGRIQFITAWWGSFAHAGRSSLNTQRPEQNSQNHLVAEDDRVTNKCPYRATARYVSSLLSSGSRNETVLLSPKDLTFGIVVERSLITSDGGWNCRTLLGIQRMVNDSPENKIIELWLQISTDLA